ncbi:hypothetical protein E2320_000751 [Naja naja]|nr:hypothetical protein E2320_000751 [Naja naja]
MDVRRLRVSELKEELGRRGLDTRGLKAELAGRLHAALEAEQARGASGSGSDGESLSDGHYGIRDNTRQDNRQGYQSFEHFNIKQENELGYERGAVSQDRSEMKTEVKEEEAPPSHNISSSGYHAPPSNYSSSVSGYNASASSYNAPPSGYNTSDSYQPWQQQQQQQPQQGHKRTFDESRGRGYYEYREDKSKMTAAELDNCDLHFKVARDRYSGYPLTIEGFAFLWSGARATYGVRRGRVCYEMKINEEISVKHLPPTEPDPHVVKRLSRMAMEALRRNPPIASLKITDFECGDDVEMSFMKNGKWLGMAYRLRKENLGGQALFPHVLAKNCAIEFNFGQREDTFFPVPPGFTFIQHLPLSERVRGTIGPKNKRECEILMMVGLPAAGKTTWAIKHAAANPAKKYNILGTNAIMDKMRVMGLRRQRNYAGRWDVLIQQATQCLNRLIQIAARKKRNYILDQTESPATNKGSEVTQDFNQSTEKLGDLDAENGTPNREESSNDQQSHYKNGNYKSSGSNIVTDSPMEEEDSAVLAMFHAVANSHLAVQSQQKDEPDFTAVQKLDILRNLYHTKPLIFLERFRTVLREEDLPCFRHLSGNYEADFYCAEVRKANLGKTLHTRVKNKRYAALNNSSEVPGPDFWEGCSLFKSKPVDLWTKGGEYFSDEQMRGRDPLLYEQYIGQYLSDEELQELGHCKLEASCSLSGILLDSYQEKVIQQRLLIQQEQEEACQEEEEEDSDQDSKDQDFNPDADEWVPDEEEKAFLREEFTSRMYQRFLEGKDLDFNYRDEEERYFDGEEPETADRMETEEAERRA